MAWRTPFRHLHIGLGGRSLKILSLLPTTAYTAHNIRLYAYVNCVLLVAHPFSFSRRPFLDSNKRRKSKWLRRQEIGTSKGEERPRLLFDVYVGVGRLTQLYELSACLPKYIFISSPRRRIFTDITKKGGCNTQGTYTNINSRQRATQLFFFSYALKTVDWLKRSTKKNKVASVICPSTRPTKIRPTDGRPKKRENKKVPVIIKNTSSLTSLLFCFFSSLKQKQSTPTFVLFVFLVHNNRRNCQWSKYVTTSPVLPFLVIPSLSVSDWIELWVDWETASINASIRKFGEQVWTVFVIIKKWERHI